MARSDSPMQIESVSELYVPPELEPLAQSVFREALRNAQKHAKPSLVTVSAREVEGVFVLEVVNDGVNGAGQRTTGMGLRLAAFEALQVGGFIEFGARDGNRWHVRLVVPTGDD